MLNVVEDADGKFVKDSGMRLTGSSGGVVLCHRERQAARQEPPARHQPRRASTRPWTAWDKLPESERRPGAIKIGDTGPIDIKHATVEPPAKASSSRSMAATWRTTPGASCGRPRSSRIFPASSNPPRLIPGHFEFYSEANPDFMWLTEAEWKSLIPANPRRATGIRCRARIIDRMCWYHLLPNALMTLELVIPGGPSDHRRRKASVPGK